MKRFKGHEDEMFEFFGNGHVSGRSSLISMDNPQYSFAELPEVQRTSQTAGLLVIISKRGNKRAFNNLLGNWFFQIGKCFDKFSKTFEIGEGVNCAGR